MVGRHCAPWHTMGRNYRSVQGVCGVWPKVIIGMVTFRDWQRTERSILQSAAKARGSLFRGILAHEVMRLGFADFVGSF